MPNRSSSPEKKKPRDLNQLAKSIVDHATGDEPRREESARAADDPKLDTSAPEKNPAAVELGRRGGLKGGKARAERLSPDQRSEIARRAAVKRWHT